MKVLFLGSNPSIRSARLVPFWRDTRSFRVLMSWLETINQGEEGITFMNVSDMPTPNNRPLKVSEIKDNLDQLKTRIATNGAIKIIALGRTAEVALTMLSISHYAMPHPSPVNRKLNDRDHIAEKINGLRVYLSPSKIE